MLHLSLTGSLRCGTIPKGRCATSIANEERKGVNMHYAKYGKQAVGSILLHSDRGINSPDTHEHSNENIDRSRTHLNYDLKERGGQTAYAYYKQRIEQIARETKERTGKSIRKDAVTLCSWAVTVPKDLAEDKTEEFFRTTYRWFTERSGEDNIVTAAVHMDESTPHMHLQFTPIVEKDGVRRLCAKDMETRRTLATAHQKLQEHLEQALGCEVNILNGATEQGNKSVLELQNETLKQQLAEKEEKARQAEERAEQAEKRAKSAERKLKEVNGQYDEATKGLKVVLNKKARASEIHKLFGDRETQTYHKNMLESTRAIGNEAYDRLTKANERLQAAKAMESRVAAREEAVAPLERKAQEEYKRAKELRENQEQLIEQKAEKIAETRVLQGMRGIATDRSQRLESFCRQLKFGDNTTALDKFEELEQQRERQALERARIKRNRGLER